LINIFSKAGEKEKTEAVQVLSDVNPTGADRTNRIMNKN
jgi:hypothetical protein